jgi:bifunctional UDP-N-acetylglucosamine pyrophosphorylase/glucosamine-1-phosphate N-acetyltransferase
MKFATIILAAGDGTRMKSRLPKPLHLLGGKPLLEWVLDSVHAAGSDRQVVITAKDSDGISELISSYQKTRKIKVDTAVQNPVQGTGHAVEQARSALSNYKGVVLVAYADIPLVFADTYQTLASALEADKNAAIACLGFDADDPQGYGRMVTDDDGNLLRIVEEKNAKKTEKAITFVNAGIMALRAPLVFELLDAIGKDAKSGEKYLTDCIEAARAKDHGVITLKARADEVAGINSRGQLAEAETILQGRLRKAAMDGGATLVAPETIFLNHDTILEQDVIIEPNVVFGPNVIVGEKTRIKSFSHIEGAVFDAGCIIGPYARIRTGTHLAEGVVIGNFVEIKNTEMGARAKANHLTYLGDSTIGARANIGAGTITCNFDGVHKYETRIGEEAFIGSNTALVAPVTVGARAMIGAGSTITQDVGDDELGLSRSEMTTITSGATKIKLKKSENSKKS